MDTLSNTMRAYLFDRERFLRRMQARAASLFEDGYTVKPGEAKGLFAIGTPTGVQYTVNALDASVQNCSCPFSQSAEVPCYCKHAIGLETLVLTVLDDLRTKIALGHYSKRAERTEQYTALFTHWQETLDAVIDLQAAKSEEEKDAELLLRESAIEHNLR